MAGHQEFIREKNRPVTGSAQTTERAQDSGSSALQKLKGHVERGGTEMKRITLTL
jgi:hypothetical protein